MNKRLLILKSKLRHLLISSLLLVVSCQNNSIGYIKDDSANDTMSVFILKVIDGDTYKVKAGNKIFKVRLLHVDCPEKREYLGKVAKLRAFNLCNNKWVKLVHKSKYDRYKRLLAEVYLDDSININQLLTREGLARHFKKYSDNHIYDSLEMIAKKEELGIWDKKYGNYK